MAQQHDASTLGMWVFLVTEVLFFGGLFMAYLVYRTQYPTAFAAGQQRARRRARRHQHLRPDLQQLDDGARGAGRADSAIAARQIATFLVLTMLFGVAFLAIKVVEYKAKFDHHLVPGPDFQWPGSIAHAAQLFFSLYFCHDRPARGCT